MMLRLILLLLLTVLAGTTVSVPVQACSVSYKKGWSPREIKLRSDVRKVEGEFRNTEIQSSEDGEAFIIGTVKTRGNRGWKTFHSLPPNPHMTSCGIGMYHKPEGDAKGTFWIKRNPRNGRFQLMLWEGEYINDEQSKRYRYEEPRDEKD